MVLTAIFTFLVKPILWFAVAPMIQIYLLFSTLVIWRAFKIVLVRRVDFLRRRHLKPVDARQAILITGASSGIGLAVAKHLYKVGYSIIATYYDEKDPGLAELTQLAQQNVAGTKKLFLHHLDLTKQDHVSLLGKQVTRQLEEHKLILYGLINNAGLGSLQPFAWLQRKKIQDLIQTNIIGALMMTREFSSLLAMCKLDGSFGSSRLIFVSSGLGFVPGATYATYGLTKCALLHFSRCMNLELKEPYGIQSVAVIPHNFIKNTNICASNVQSNQSAWDELKPEERVLYGREYEQHLERTRSLERATKEHGKLSNKRGQRNNKQQRASKSSASNENLLLYSCKSVVAFLSNAVACLRGENRAASLEESGVLECFEDALRLKNPPEEIFAGDVMFQLIVGSLLLSLPHCCKGLLSASVAPSLYK